MIDFKLLKEVVEQIKLDASNQDYTAIEELLNDIPKERLIGFLKRKELTWSESMLEIEGVGNEEISRLQKQQTQQSRELAELLTKSLYIIKRGY